MKRVLIATLMGSFAITGATFAHTATAPNDFATPTERMNPATATDTAPATGLSAAGDSAAMQSEGGFFTYQEGNQMLGTHLATHSAVWRAPRRTGVLFALDGGTP